MYYFYGITYTVFVVCDITVSNLCASIFFILYGGVCLKIASCRTGLLALCILHAICLWFMVYGLELRFSFLSETLWT